MANSRLRSEAPLILASIFIAFVIWLIAKQSEMETDRLLITVQLQNVPAYMSVETPPQVRINVQYPQDLRNQIVSSNFTLPINVGELFSEKPEQWNPPTEAKTVDYTLQPGSVKTDLGSTVQVVGITPKRISITASLRTRLVAIKVQMAGQPPSNLTFLAPPKPDPDKLLVTGSSEALFKLAEGGDNLPTEPINLSALKASGQLYPHVILPEGVTLLGREDKRVTVNIGLTEKPVRQALVGVPISIATFTEGMKAVITPPTAEVILEGPASALKSVSPDDIVFSTAKELGEQSGKVYVVGLEAHLKNTVLGNVAQKIRIVEIKPSRISVEFVPVDKQNRAEGARSHPRR